MTTATATRPASAASLRYLRSLQVELARIVGSDKTEHSADDVAYSQRLTSAAIDAMKQAITIARAARPAVERPAPAPAAPLVELEDGIYFLDGQVIKVRHAVHGSGHQYARGLDLNDRTPGGKARFSAYVPGAMRRLTPGHLMTKEQAIEFGATYGTCCRCGATLTDETSIERALGPICAGKF